MFRNREDAADQLITQLAKYRHAHTLVLGIPRGAVPMAKHIADALGAEFDVVLARKLGAPDNPEYAIGAIAEDGWVCLLPDAQWSGATPDYIEADKAKQRAVILARKRQYDAIRSPHTARGKNVIVVDDGLATGATMMAALHGLRAQEPAKLICAVPVSPQDTLLRIRGLCDEVVCLLVPTDFHAVAQFYLHFAQVSDEEVLACLRGSSKTPRASPPGSGHTHQ
ncbi:MAG: hypothetical protein RIR70_174 [Pseudomonadota bacterium]|jgi:predicted phosphoribosyltransferase